MASAYVQSNTGSNVTSGTSVTAALTGVGVGNLLIFAIRFAAQTRTVSSISGGGTWVRGPSKMEGSSYAMEVWYCLNSTGGNVTADATMSAAITNARAFLIEYSGILTAGAFDQSAIAVQAATSSPQSVGPITPTQSGSLIFTAAFNLTDSRTLVVPSGYTARATVVSGITASGGMMLADQRQTSAAAISADWTWTGGTLTGALTVMSFKEVLTGPAIDTQPTAQTVRLNGESTVTATFTVAATTSGGAMTYDWELEDGVASGVYANLANGSGATWTGQTSTSAVGTFAATTLSGRRVRCNVTDNNGTTTTNAVALTVLAGPVVTASSSATNGSGVGTLAYHSDDALTTNGELLLTTVVAGRVGNQSTFYIVTRPA